MKISEQILLEFKIKLESLITERESMIATNQGRLANGLSIAYDEPAFYQLQCKFDEQYIKLIKLGEK